MRTGNLWCYRNVCMCSICLCYVQQTHCVNGIHSKRPSNSIQAKLLLVRLIIRLHFSLCRLHPFHYFNFRRYLSFHFVAELALPLCLLLVPIPNRNILIRKQNSIYTRQVIVHFNDFASLFIESLVACIFLLDVFKYNRATHTKAIKNILTPSLSLSRARVHLLLVLISIVTDDQIVCEVSAWMKMSRIFFSCVCSLLPDP